MSNLAELPALIIFFLGAISSGYMIFRALLPSSKLLKSEFGILLTLLLATIFVGTLIIGAATFASIYAPNWLQSKPWFFPTYGAFRSCTGVALALLNFQIALERYYVTCGESGAPTKFKFWIIVHALGTMILIAVCYGQSQTNSFRRPGIAWARYLVLVCVLQYMLIAFGGVLFIYYKTYACVFEAIKTTIAIADTFSRTGDAIRKRVFKKCILLCLSVVTLYAVESAILLLSLSSSDWMPPVEVSALAAILMAMDGVVTPFLVYFLHKDILSDRGSSARISISSTDSKK